MLRPLVFITVCVFTMFAFLAVACSGETLPPKGQLMVVFTSDMAPPKDFDVMHVEISRSGKLLHSQDYDIATGPAPNKLPATLGIVSGTDPSEPVDIRVVARQGGPSGKARVLRDVRTLVPTDRVAALPITIQWLCDGSAKDENGSISPACGNGLTCIAGQCKSPEEGTSDLADYDPNASSGAGSESACFDTLACFAEGNIVDVKNENGTCSFAKPADSGKGINVALVGAPGTAGVCGTKACLIPLDKNPVTGWSEQGNRIVLPQNICEKVPTIRVAVTTTCESKVAGLGTCGAWSTAGPGASDAPPPKGDTSQPDGGNAGGIVLTVDPPAVGILPGKTAPINVKIMRTGTFTARANVSVRDLPANVTAAPMTIEPGADTTTLTISAAAQATTGSTNIFVDAKSDDGTITSSAPMTLSVRGAAGTVDVGFGDAGVASAQTPDGSVANAIAVQADGKVVIAGFLQSTNKETAITRFSKTGQLDTTFGTNGTAVSTISDVADDEVAGVAIQADGRIYAVGSSGPLNNTRRTIRRRFEVDGATDSTIVTTDLTPAPGGSQGNAIAFQGSGAPVIVGTVRIGAEGGAPGEIGIAGNFLADGGFSTVRPFNGNFFGTVGLGVVRLPNDSIVGLGGSTSAVCPIVRVLADGAADTTFGGGGSVSLDGGFSDCNTRAGVLQPDGKLVTIGDRAFGFDAGFMLTRLLPDGGFDPSFNTNGTQWETLMTASRQGRGVGLQSDGKVVAMVVTALGVDSTSLHRFNPNGTVDTAFGTNGTLTIPSSLMMRGNAMLITADDTALIAGIHPATGKMAVVRVWL